MPDVWLRYIRVAEAIARRRITARGPPSASTDLVDIPAYAWSGSGREKSQATRGSIDRRTLETRHGAGRDQDTRVVAAANFDVWYGMSCPCPDVGQVPEAPATGRENGDDQTDSKGLRQNVADSVPGEE